MGRVICFFLMLVASKNFAQESISDKLKGKIVADLSNLEGIHVINLKTEKVVITEKSGDFLIEAIPGDSLLFSSGQFKSVKILLNRKHFENELLLVKMVPIINILKEVVVTSGNDAINAVSLGIIPKGQKSLTVSERRLYTATDLNATGSVSGMAGGSMSIDPLINLLSGRTKMLKKELEVERKEMGLRQLENMFDKAYFIDKLKIPLDYVKGFQYYLMEIDRFVKVLKVKNKENVEFVMGELAAKYNEMIAGEK